MGSVREVEEYLIHPNMIKELTRGECFMVSKYPYSRIAKVFVNYSNFAHMGKEELMMELYQLNDRPEKQRLTFENVADVNKEKEVNEEWL